MRSQIFELVILEHPKKETGITKLIEGPSVILAKDQDQAYEMVIRSLTNDGYKIKNEDRLEIRIRPF